MLKTATNEGDTLCKTGLEVEKLNSLQKFKKGIIYGRIYFKLLFNSGFIKRTF